MRGTDYIIKRTMFAIMTVFVAITLELRAVPGAARKRGHGAAVRPLHEAVPRVDRQAVRARQVEVGAVRRLPPAARPRRPGHIHVRQPAGVGRHQDAALEHPADDRRRDGVLDRHRGHLGGGGRLAARHGRGLDQPVDGARVLRDADAVDRPARDLLHRHPAGPAGERDRVEHARNPLDAVDMGRVQRPRLGTCSCRRSRSGSACTASTR